MKKRYKLTGIDCANCAAKLENEIKKVAGVRDATVNFMTQKLVVEAGDERFDQVINKVASVIRRVEPDCILSV
jgi:copper chaperone CopZ